MKTVLDFTAPRQADAARLQHGFGVPEKVLQAHSPEEVPAILEAVQRAAEQGQWCVGWLAYEAASAFDGAYAQTVHSAVPGQPLAWFGVHAAPQAVQVAPKPLPTPPVRPVQYDFGPGAVPACAAQPAPALPAIALADVEGAGSADTRNGAATPT